MRPPRTRSSIPSFTTKFQGRVGAGGGVRHREDPKGRHTRILQPGRGSSFQVLFPAVAAKAADHGPRIASTEAPAAGTILFIDDEEALRRLAQSALERDGWVVLLAENGAEGVPLI